jgi:hypothetical protein
MAFFCIFLILSENILYRMSESELELCSEEVRNRRRRRRKRGAKKKSGFAIFSNQLISGDVTASPGTSSCASVLADRKLSSLELDNLEDSLSSTAIAETPPGMSQVSPDGSVVSTQSMWELGSYEDSGENDWGSSGLRPIIRSPMMMLAANDDSSTKVDDIVAGIESVLSNIQSVAGTQFSRLCVPIDSGRGRRMCLPTRVKSDGFLEVLERVKCKVSNSVDEILSRMNPPERFGQVFNNLEKGTEMTNVPVLNRRQKRSILFGAPTNGGTSSLSSSKS